MATVTRTTITRSVDIPVCGFRRLSNRRLHAPETDGTKTLALNFRHFLNSKSFGVRVKSRERRLKACAEAQRGPNGSNDRAASVRPRTAGALWLATLQKRLNSRSTRPSTDSR